jgi:hypothetical protein
MMVGIMICRSYFRCTHKYDQHCAAQRQVQLCDDAPDTYRVTYIGVHTCQDPATGADTSALPAGSRLISFAPNNGSTPTTSTSTTNNQNQQQPDDNLQEGALLPGLPPLKLEGGVDQEEVLSSLTPSGSGRNLVRPDQGDVTSDLHFFIGDDIDGIRFTMDDDTFHLEDIFCF